MINIEEVADLIEAKNQLKKAHEKLSRYENELIVKDQRVQMQEREVRMLINGYTEEKRKLDQEKDEVVKEKMELDVKIIDVDGLRVRLLKEKEDFAIEKEKIYREHQELYGSKLKIDKDLQESEKIYATNMIQSAYLAEEMEKLEEIKAVYQIDCEKLEKEAEEIARIKESLEFERMKIVNERQLLTFEREEVEKLKKIAKKEVEGILKDKEEVEKLKKKLEIQNLELQLMIESRAAPVETLKLASLFRQLEEAMDNYNDEVTKREVLLSQKNIEYIRSTEKLMNNLENLKRIQEGLEQSKHEIYVFYSEVIPELERISKKNVELKDEIQEKFKTVESLYTKMIESALRQSNVKDPAISFITFHEKHYEMTKKDKVDYLFDNRNIDMLAKELFNRIKSLNVREKDLDKQEKDLRQIIETIQRSKDSLSQNRRSLDEERDEFKKQTVQLEQAIRSLSTKEKEMLFLKQELDRRAVLLKNRENQIELRVYQARDTKIASK